MDFKGNHLLVTTIGQGALEVTLHPQPVQIGIYPRTMRAGASCRTAVHGNMTIIGMISATSLKIGGAFRIE
jgi:hypothetical protein